MVGEKNWISSKSDAAFEQGVHKWPRRTRVLGLCSVCTLWSPACSSCQGAAERAIELRAPAMQDGSGKAE